MSDRCLRLVSRICYYESDKPSLDEFVYCDKCGELVYEYCSIHGPLLVIPDDKVTNSYVPSFVPKAALTIPKVFLHIAPSSIPDAGLGVFTTLDLPARVRFGPFIGQRTNGVDSHYCWQIYDSNRKPSHSIDAVDTTLSNWMRYVNCARHWSEQNLVAFQYRGQVYYRTVKIIPKHTELLVFYGSEFANELDVDLRRYNSPIHALTRSGEPEFIAEESYTNERETAEVEVSVLDDVRKNWHSLENAGKNFDEKGNAINNCLTNNTFISNDVDTKQISLFDLYIKKKYSSISNIPVEKNNVLNFCNACGQKFFLVCDLENHMRFHDRNRIHECSVCTYRFTSLRHLRNHEFSIHKKTAPNVIIRSCKICQKKFSNNTALKKHEETHTGEKPFSCDICNNKFTRNSHLKTHLRVHTGEKAFSCEICKKKFYTSKDLNNHIRTHTGEKPFSCDICNNNYTRSSNLKRHLRVHTVEKAFLCEICKNKYYTSKDLNNHIRTHTGEKPFSCEN